MKEIRKSEEEISSTGISYLPTVSVGSNLTQFY